MNDMFDNYNDATLWYHPLADRLFLFHKSNFLMLPCLEREDGKKLLTNDPYNVNADIIDVPLEYTGKL